MASRWTGRRWSPAAPRRIRRTRAAGSAFLTSWVAADILNPVMAGFFNAVAATRPMFGWPCDETIEKMRDQFAKESDPAKQKQIVDRPAEVLGRCIRPTSISASGTSRSRMRTNIDGTVVGAGAGVLEHVEEVARGARAGARPIDEGGAGGRLLPWKETLRGELDEAGHARRHLAAMAAGAVTGGDAGPGVLAQSKVLTLRAERQPDDPRSDLDDGLRHAQPRLPDLRHAVRVGREQRGQAADGRQVRGVAPTRRCGPSPCATGWSGMTASPSPPEDCIASHPALGQARRDGHQAHGLRQGVQGGRRQDLPDRC